ncbi:MAG: DUF3822 family protein [Crocinitomicaceae bacterium]|nr:DUF3822 family protein [Crocinitomicaceae bacterium]
MDLKPGQLNLALVHKADKKIVDFQRFTDFDFTRDGVDRITSNEIFKAEYADFILTAGSVRNTLVPTGIFNNSKPLDIFKLNYTAPHENLDYNRIPELDIVNIYELPIWVKSAFVIKFPRVKMYHRSSVLLKGIFDQPVFYPKVHLFIEDSSFYMFITEKSKLIFFNRFDYKNLADIVYHTLFVLEQKMLEQDKLSVQLYGVAPGWNHLNEFKSFFKCEVNVPDTPEKGEHFILAKQLLCV